MRVTILTALAGAILATALAEQPEPLVTVAPSGQYRIIQRPGRKNASLNITGYDEDNVLRFRDQSKPDVVLKAPTPFDAWGRHSRGVVNRVYAADYFISPDERWIVRDQKVGSGCNALILYRVQPNGSVQRFALNRPAFDCIGLSPDHYVHMGVQFVSWDLRAGLVRLEVSANGGMRSSSRQQTVSDTNAYPDINARRVSYDFNTHRMKAE